jgi:RecA/RadA recombinase
MQVVDGIGARSATLEQLRDVCRLGRMDAGPRVQAFPTGFGKLDDVLPGGGWPVGAITELLIETPRHR